MTIVLHRQTHEIFERIYSSISPTVIGLITPALLVSASLSLLFFRIFERRSGYYCDYWRRRVFSEFSSRNAKKKTKTKSIIYDNNERYRVVKSLLNIQADCCTYVANGMIFPNFIISVTQNSLEIGLYTGCPINSTKPRYTPHGYTITDSSLP